MDYKPELKGRINQKDEDGCTVLHVVAAHSPGYLTKRKWQHHSDSGVGNPRNWPLYLFHPVMAFNNQKYQIMRPLFFLYFQLAFQKKAFSDIFCAWKSYLVITLLEKKYLYRFKLKKILWLKIKYFFSGFNYYKIIITTENTKTT